MKVHKITLLIVDLDELGAHEITWILENADYPNDCISPCVMETESREVEWTDDHPLNRKDTMRQAFEELFDKK